MATTPARPIDLPDFEAPPLNEVVLGVQFESPKGYQQIFAGEVWKLYRNDYPQVQEQPPLAPNFETFGLRHQNALRPPISFSTGASHDRFWFLRPEGDELIQFQQDRFLHNWRKRQEAMNGYPRFEPIVERFQDELMQLQDYLATLSPQTLAINQCEVCYVNHLPVDPTGVSRPSDWLRFLGSEDFHPDDLSMTFRQVIRDEAGKPQSRLYVEVKSAFLPSNEEVVVFSLTVRGAPAKSDIQSAIDFLAAGRKVIVEKFAELTTSTAHEKWKRTK